MSNDEHILQTILAVGAKYKKAYSYPSQDTILRLLKAWYRLRISKRTLNRRLKALQAEGYFERIRRIKKANSGKLLFNSTLYKFKRKAFRFMAFLSEQSHKFFSSFRVPKLANHFPFRGKKSSVASLSHPPPGDQKEIKGSRSAPLSTASAEIALARVRQLIASLPK